jgi:hypothetical protein
MKIVRVHVFTDNKNFIKITSKEILGSLYKQYLNSGSV